MVKCLIILLTLALATPIAAQAPTRTSSWCSPPRSDQRPLDEFAGIHIQFLSQSSIPGAMRLLARRSIVPLDPARYRNMLGRGIPADGRYLYLVRGGVMAPAEMSDAEVPAYAERASYYPHEDILPGTLLVVSLMTSERRQEPRSVPLLIASARPVRNAAAYCIGGR